MAFIMEQQGWGGEEVLGGHSCSQALTILAFYQSGCEREAGERGVRV